MLFRLLILFPALFAARMLPGQAPVWPVPGEAFAEGRPYAEFVQPTAAGTPESALFGCVRNNGNRFHEAIDIAPVLDRRKGEATDPVSAIHDGVVVHVNRIAGNSSYGRYVVLEHRQLDLPVYSLYAHLARLDASIKEGVEVKAGDQLGIMGRSAGGYSIPRTRAHLHLEVGLRLSDEFQEWYDRQGYSSLNQHGNYNGMNLVGWDPLDYFTAFRDRGIESVLGYFEQLPVGVMLHIRTQRIPDFLQRYPQLLLPGCDEEQRAGWEVSLSAWGLPLSLKPLRERDLVGVARAGDISVVALNEAAIEEFSCRNILTDRSGQFMLGTGGRQVVELLFKPD